MSEVTEFMVWRSALADTPQLAAALLTPLPRPLPEAVTADLEAMLHTEAAALAQLQALLGPESGPLPADTEPPAGWEGEPLAAWSDLRHDLLTLLERVNEATLLASRRLPSGKPLSPYRLAGELADHDVRMLARLRRR